jgi:arsenical pump membrane protein
MHSVVMSLSATWPPFVLVAGLLLIGHVASDEGLFRRVGTWCARVPGGARGVFLVTMAAVALVTAILNLDTSVVFMTPVALQAARARGADETAFVFGAIFMSNSASLLLPGSNLTNLLVWSDQHGSGATFASQMAWPWVVSISITVLVVGAWRWRPLGKSTPARAEKGSSPVGPGVVGVLLAVVAMVALSQPALWVFAVGVIAETINVVRHRVTMSDALRAANPLTLAILFLIALIIGTVARATKVSAHLLHHASAALVINNLPAASLFAARGVAHPFALLLGLDLGPNIFVTGALSSLLWLRISRENKFQPSLRVFFLVGSVIAISAIACSVTLV